MASRSSSTCTLAARRSGDGFAVWPAAVVSELTIAADIKNQPSLVRISLVLLQPGPAIVAGICGSTQVNHALLSGAGPAEAGPYISCYGAGSIRSTVPVAAVPLDSRSVAT